MSFLSGIGHALGKVGKAGGKVLGGVGDAVQHLAPALGLIPGVGTLAGGIIGGAGGLLGNLNDQHVDFGHVLGNVAKGGLGGAAGGLANGALLGGKGIGGLSSLLKIGLPGAKGLAGKTQSAADMFQSLTGAGMDPAQAQQLANGTANNIEAGGRGGVGGLSGLLGKLGGAISGHPMQALGIGAGAAAAGMGLAEQQKAQAAQQAALAQRQQLLSGGIDKAQGAYDAKAPMRAAGAGALNNYLQKPVNLFGPRPGV